MHSDPSSPHYSAWHAEQRRIHDEQSGAASMRLSKKRQSSFDTECAPSGDEFNSSAMNDDDDENVRSTPKRHMAKPIPGSSVDLRQRFLDPESWNEHCCS